MIHDLSFVHLYFSPIKKTEHVYIIKFRKPNWGRYYNKFQRSTNTNSVLFFPDWKIKAGLHPAPASTPTSREKKKNTHTKKNIAVTL